jgi:hypothetical protein
MLKGSRIRENTAVIKMIPITVQWSNISVSLTPKLDL